MNRVAVAIIAFAFAALGASLIRDAYQDGRMPILFFGTINPLVFSRDENPTWFLGATVLNVLVISLLGFGGIAMLAIGER